MTDEQKKIALVAVAGGGGLILLIYLMRSGSPGYPQAIPIGSAAAGYTPLDVPANGDITYNFPGIAPPAATVDTPALPSCTKVCDECDDNSAYAGTSMYKIPQSAVNGQYGNYKSAMAGGAAMNTSLFVPLSPLISGEMDFS